MIPVWAVRLDPRDAASAAALRLRTGVEVLETSDSVWLRGSGRSEALDHVLSLLPVRGRFDVRPDGRLVARGERLASRRLPEGEWAAVAAWCLPASPSPGMPGRIGEKVCLKLAAGAPEQEPSVLICDLDSWADWAGSAPAVRLERLHFAADDVGRVLTWGSPLPPLRGERYTESGGIAVPCGLRIDPPVEPAALHSRLGTSPRDLVLFRPDGSFERVAAGQFAAASRSAARLTARRRGFEP
ncbi:MAG: hypothetical protein HYY93_13600 [Planctomycetes bacterium]|nr:hypothetical protein [Planctomycetota bacterium]